MSTEKLDFKPDKAEPKNLDQTDFIDNSTLSFSEQEIFPQTELPKASVKSANSSRESKPILPKPLIILTIVMLIILFILAILLLITRGNLPTSNGSPAKPSQNPNRDLIKNLNDQIYLTNQLNQSFVIPYTDNFLPPVD